MTDYETALRAEPPADSNEPSIPVFVRDDGEYTNEFPTERIVRRADDAGTSKFVVYGFIGTHDNYEERVWTFDMGSLAVAHAEEVYGVTPDPEGSEIAQGLAEDFSDHGGEVFEVEVHEVPGDEFVISSTTEDELQKAIADRLEDDEWDGEAIDTIIGEGVTFLWDTWADPVVTVWPDSSYYTDDYDGHLLSDYHDEIRKVVDRAFAENDRHPTSWEFSPAVGVDESGPVHNFHSSGVMEGDY